jgi:hypothetical protein
MKQTPTWLRGFWRSVAGVWFLLVAGLGASALQGCGMIIPAGEALPPEDVPQECEPLVAPDADETCESKDATLNQEVPIGYVRGIPGSPGERE